MRPVMVRMLRQECMQRLSGHSVGRVAVTAHALPAIVPVNYALDDHSIVFRTKGDGLLARGCDGNVVAFEVDDVAADGSGGWSILVVGVAHLLAGSQAVRAARLDIVSAMGNDRDQFISIDIGRVSGRRVGAQAAYDDALARVGPEPTQALRARDVMSAPVRVASVRDTMWDAWSVMLEFGLRHVVVCDGHRCAGVLDDRMLFTHWPTGAFGVTSTPVRDLMRSRTSCVLPETSLARVARVMANEGVDAVPVTDVDGTVLGIVTAGDITRAVARYDLGSHECDEPSEPVQLNHV